MTARTRSPQGRTPVEADAESSLGTSTERLGWAEVPVRLRLAVLVAAVGAVLVAVGPTLGVTSGGPPPGYRSGPLLIVLAVLPVVLAAALLLARRPILAAGALVGSALLAPGAALGDLQFAVDALATSRPELLVPASLAPLAVGQGVWLLLAGHAATALAGLLAAGRAGARPGSAMAVAFEESALPVLPGPPPDPGPPAAGPAAGPELSGRRRWLARLLVAGVVTAIGLLMPPFDSDDAFQPPRDLMSSPAAVMVGGLLIAAAVLVACVIAGSAAPSYARGVVLGVAVGTLAVVVPGQVAGFLVPRLAPDWRSFLAVAGVVALVALALWPTRGKRRRAPEQAVTDVTVGGTRLRIAAGLLGLLAAALAAGGVFGTLLVLKVPTDRPISATDLLYLKSGVQPVTFANRLLLPAAVLLAVLALALLVRPVAAAVRPAFTVACAAVPLAGMLALDAVVTVSGTGASIRPGLGAWSSVLAIVFAGAAAICAALAGGVERDDVDLSERRANVTLVAPVAAAALFAVGAFGLPTLTAPGYVPAGIWSEFRLASWGLLAALLTVLVAGVVAVFSRPARAVALLLGASALVAVHLLELPLTGERVLRAGTGPGTWLSVACVAALIVGAVVAVVARPLPRTRTR